MERWCWRLSVPISVKGTMQSVTNANGHTMNMNFTFSSKYLGPACGDVK